MDGSDRWEVFANTPVAVLLLDDLDRLLRVLPSDVSL